MLLHRRPSKPDPIRAPDGSVVPLSRVMSDADLGRALLDEAGWAPAVLYDRYAPDVERLIVRLLGAGPDVDDVFQDVFAAAFRGVRALREPERLRPWLLRIAVLTVRQHLRSKRRRRWLIFSAPPDLPETALEPGDDEREAAARTYRLLDRLDAEDRIPFLLQLLTPLELTEIAEMCGVSLATVKRRIARAARQFEHEARNDEVLTPWLSEAPTAE